MDEPITKGDQARAEIVTAARRLFIENGYNGTSMRAIAEAAGGRAVGGLYNHFKTKEEIFSAIVEAANPYEDLIASFAGIEAETAPDFLRAALGRALRVMPRHYEFFQIVQIDLREFQGEHLNHVFQAQVLPEVSVALGRISMLPGLKPVDPVEVMRLVASLGIGYIITGTLAPTGLFTDRPDDAWIELYLDMALYGLADESQAAKG